MSNKYFLVQFYFLILFQILPGVVGLTNTHSNIRVSTIKIVLKHHQTSIKLKNKANYIHAVNSVALFRTRRGKSSSKNEIKSRKLWWRLFSMYLYNWNFLTLSQKCESRSYFDKLCIINIRKKH